MLCSLRGLATFIGPFFLDYINSKCNFKIVKNSSKWLITIAISYKSKILTKFKSINLECNQMTDQLKNFQLKVKK